MLRRLAGLALALVLLATSGEATAQKYHPDVYVYSTLAETDCAPTFSLSPDRAWLVRLRIVELGKGSPHSAEHANLMQMERDRLSGMHPADPTGPALALALTRCIELLARVEAGPTAERPAVPTVPAPAAPREPQAEPPKSFDEALRWVDTYCQQARKSYWAPPPLHPRCGLALTVVLAAGSAAALPAAQLLASHVEDRLPRDGLLRVLHRARAEAAAAPLVGLLSRVSTRDGWWHPVSSVLEQLTYQAIAQKLPSRAARGRALRAWQRWLEQHGQESRAEWKAQRLQAARAAVGTLLTSKPASLDDVAPELRFLMSSHQYEGNHQDQSYPAPPRGPAELADLELIVRASQFASARARSDARRVLAAWADSATQQLREARGAAAGPVLR